jgi:hypothetical protein
MRRAVRHDNFFADHKREKHLQKAYSTSAVEKIVRDVKTIMNAEGADSIKVIGRRDDFDRLDVSLRSAKEKKSTGDVMAGGVACNQWMRQLAADYPEKFNRVSCAGERPEDAIIMSTLFVLKLHGDPLSEGDWYQRQVWLSHAGRIWVTAKDSDMDIDGCAALCLGGSAVKDLHFYKARAGVETIDSIGGQPLYAFGVNGVHGARFDRKKYFAAHDIETRDRWIRVCSSYAAPTKPVPAVAQDLDEVRRIRAHSDSALVDKVSIEERPVMHRRSLTTFADWQT